MVDLDLTDPNQECPPGTALRTDLSLRLCGPDFVSSGCSSTIFDVQGIEYGHVCGKIIAYQFGSPDTFSQNGDLEGVYVDGISLTHGSNPREHIWTFAAGLDEVGSFPALNCPCTNSNLSDLAMPPPPFVGNNYFCDTAAEERFQSNFFYSDDPLFDGDGCGPYNTCCSLNNPPWFFRELPSLTAEDIEMRLCRTADRTNEGTPFQTIEIYVY